MMHHPTLAGPFLAYNAVLLEKPALGHRNRELITLRVAVAHRLGVRVGATRAPRGAGRHDDGRDRRGPRSARVRGRRSRPTCSPRPTSSSTASGSTTTPGPASREHLDESQLVEVVFVVGTYTCLAMAFNSFGLQLDPTADPASANRGVAMARFPKPAEGSWTAHYPELGTAPISYEDSISPEIHDLEREAIFKRSWLNVGRVEQLSRKGSYFTKELAFANTSVVIVRDMSGEVRAFHNICRHRGNKLVWTDFPREETSGNCRQFVCKYHGWKYELDGACSYVQQESEFFDLDKSRLRPGAGALRRVVGVHLREPRRPNRARRCASSSGRWSPRSRATRSTSRPSASSTAPKSGATGSSSWTRSRSSTTHRFCTRSSRRSRRDPKCKPPASKDCTTRSKARIAW